ncbi:2-oxoglutarate ferredoxin oxidoreductase subunit alpha [Runella defluvii]|uniref:2-oxoglutarate ferredoxin oxidoreductase subunit alpha n=1 Tax=Runella defluvii TaxID=370973 RepID=A0A7W5ZLW4_9BACT|nr:2-oxoacid:acceptor oxidoreductase subunit alpha [Runella defluvii]MBB3839645.1 2-oxoglutarate ferredoxin oxidoreductase subunit alpha [Runella defluvii]
MRNLTGINDLVVRFANVNGTGSASANNMFAMSIFRMGIPMTAKNIFPSNIQGLPTWYEVRVSEKGYLGRREGVDVLVCVNPQSMKQDIASVKSGGYFVYDNTKNLHKDFIREDINYIGIPMIGICMRLYQDPRQRQLFKNMIYVGALAALLDIELEVVKGIIADEFAKKPKLIEPNVQAMMEGVKYVQDNYSYPLHVRVERRDLVGDSIVIDGNTACGLGAVYAGATVAGWYPITPSTSLVEAFAKYANKYRLDPETGLKKVAIVQAEDELAAFGMVLGASWNGARAFTATSGPGVSLMNEFLGLAYFAEIPAVLVDVQRGGPSTGMPTRTQQSDLLLAAYASHGDTKHVLLLPSTPTECFNLMADAFDLAERLQTPVIVMTDLDLGMNDHLTAPLKWDDSRRYDRGKVYTAQDLDDLTAVGKQFGRYLDVDGDGIPYRTIPATHPTKGSFFTRGTSHDEYARYTEDGVKNAEVLDRLLKKWDTAKEITPKPEFYQTENKSNVGVIFFGTTTYAALEAMDLLREEEGIALDAMRATAFPFHSSVEEFISAHDQVFVIEQNRDAQFRTLLINELEVNPKKLIKILNYDGMPITAEAIRRQIAGVLATV